MAHQIAPTPVVEAGARSVLRVLDAHQPPQLTLRTRRKLSAKDIINAVMESAPDLDPPDQNYVWRIETGKIGSPGFRLIAALTRAVQGNPDDVVRLVLDEHATDEDAKRLAMNWLSREHSEHIDRIAGSHDEADVLAAIRDMREELARLERRFGGSNGGS